MGLLKAFENIYPLIQVVGYKGSGKTTLINKILSTIVNDLPLKVAVLIHRGEPDIVKGTDSYEPLQAGAYTSGVHDEDRLQLKIT